MSPCYQPEMGGRSTQGPEDSVPFLGEVMGKEETRRSKEMKCAEKGNQEAMEEEKSNSLSSLVPDRSRVTQPNNSVYFATENVDNEREEEQEQPDRQLTHLEIPGFLLSDAPEDDCGKHSMSEDSNDRHTFCRKIRRSWKKYCSQMIYNVQITKFKVQK